MPAVPQVGRADEEGAIGKEQVGEVIDLVFALKKVRIRGKKKTRHHLSFVLIGSC